MSVTKYINNDCRYRIDKLQNVVYLIDENNARTINIDNGRAYVTLASNEDVLRIDCYGIDLQDGDELNGRYSFTHTLKFSVNGYMNHRDLMGKYYVIVKSYDNEYWLVNPMFPCKVEYLFTLGYNTCKTDFTLSMISNHPTLMVDNLDLSSARSCNGYRLIGFDTLQLNENAYCTNDGQDVYYTNDGFKNIIFDKGSATLTEDFDGNNLSHQLQFSIRFDNYKSSWHYNLLEFHLNTYAAIITDTNGGKIFVGFDNGLQPHYTVTSNGEMTPDKIDIVMKDYHSDGRVLRYYENVNVEKNENVNEQYASRVDNVPSEEIVECVADGKAIYILKQQTDAFGNPNGKYLVLDGYQSKVSNLGLEIVGTFNEEVEYNEPLCNNVCVFKDNMEGTIVFTDVTSKTYSITVDTNWTATSTNNGITVSPSTGTSGTTNITISNSITPTDPPIDARITFSFCNSERIVDVIVKEEQNCLPNGDTYRVDASAQWLVVPTQCCIKELEQIPDTVESNRISDNYVRIFVPRNDSGEPKIYVLQVTYCDGTLGTITIIQGNMFIKWVDEGYECQGINRCKKQRMWSGITEDFITAPTEITRLADCEPSTVCVGYFRWVETERTACDGDKLHIVEKRQASYDGVNWSDTGETRLGREIEDTQHQCSEAEYEYQWVLTDDYICGEAPKLYVKLLNNTDYTIPCDSTNLITTADTKSGLFETSAVTDAYIGDCVSGISNGSFAYAGVYKNLSSVTMSDSVIGIGNDTDDLQLGAFDNAIKLSDVTLSKNLVYIGGSSFFTTSLQTIDIPDSVKRIRWRAFAYNFGLKSVKLSNSLEYIGANAFADCIKLRTIRIPKTVTEIGNEAFRGCTLLSSVVVEATSPPLLGTDVFAMTRLSAIYVPRQAVNDYITERGWVNYANIIQPIS